MAKKKHRKGKKEKLVGFNNWNSGGWSIDGLPKISIPPPRAAVKMSVNGEDIGTLEIDDVVGMRYTQPALGKRYRISYDARASYCGNNRSTPWVNLSQVDGVYNLTLPDSDKVIETQSFKFAVYLEALKKHESFTIQTQEEIEWERWAMWVRSVLHGKGNWYG